MVSRHIFSEFPSSTARTAAHLVGFQAKTSFLIQTNPSPLHSKSDDRLDFVSQHTGTHTNWKLPAMTDGNTSLTLHSRKALNPSELGTREYWDNVYAREIYNYDEASEDEGTVWFSESGAEGAVLAQLNNLEQDGVLSRNTAQFLDLGTGNGHMLFVLRQGGDDEDLDDDEEALQPWKGRMLGVDYSVPSVDLARRIALNKFPEEDASTLGFRQWDLLADQPGEWLNDGFDVVLDKGTFDAISLMDYPADNAAPHPCYIYRERVLPLVKPGGFLFVTSCNWTKTELIGWLVDEGRGDLTLYGEVKYPTFTFGGQTGQSIVTVLFQKNDR